jgi:hypothetical protein
LPLRETQIPVDKTLLDLNYPLDYDPFYVLKQNHKQMLKHKQRDGPPEITPYKQWQENPPGWLMFNPHLYNMANQPNRD